jgi:LPS sulfotransferase NodH
MSTPTLYEKLRWRVHECSAQAPYWMAENGLLPGNREYRPFVLLCDIRTGSNMLASCLRSHSHVLMLSEIFKHSESKVYFSVDGFRSRAHDQEVVELRDTDPVQFLEQEVFRTYPAHLRAVGFKLLYTQARSRRMWWDGPEYADWWEHMDDRRRTVWWDAHSDVWDYLRSRTDIKVIQLVRENLLRQKLSAKMAQATDKWGKTEDASSNPDDKPQVRLDPETCRRDFAARERMRREAEEDFERHDLLQVSYEQLTDTPDETLKRVQRFLSLQVESLQTGKKKQETRSLREAIANYSELYDELADTPWARFFDNTDPNSEVDEA